MTDPTAKQIDYLLQLANKLTGERARYASQSSIDLRVKGAAEASALIDDLKAAIEAHEKWQAETGLVIGSRLRHHYVTGKGVKIVAEGEILSYKWDGDLRVSEIFYDATPETRQAAGFSDTVRTKVIVDRLGDPAGDDPEALRAERERLLARVAEIDALLAKS